MEDEFVVCVDLDEAAVLGSQVFNKVNSFKLWFFRKFLRIQLLKQTDSRVPVGVFLKYLIVVINIVLFNYFIGVLFIIIFLGMFPSGLIRHFSKDILKNSIAKLTFCLMF